MYANIRIHMYLYLHTDRYSIDLQRTNSVALITTLGLHRPPAWCFLFLCCECLRVWLCLDVLVMSARFTVCVAQQQTQGFHLYCGPYWSLADESSIKNKTPRFSYTSHSGLCQFVMSITIAMISHGLALAIGSNDHPDPFPGWSN